MLHFIFSFLVYAAQLQTTRNKRFRGTGAHYVPGMINLIAPWLCRRVCENKRVFAVQMFLLEAVTS